jgi:predicted 3-demethylubiquinone-9 3-methyltransferase (glyoxalase superfamily)
MMNPIYPCLWFDGQAKAAAEFYCSLFPNSKITADTPMVVTFELNGRKLMGLNGGPQFKFNEAVSFVVECETQEEIDFYWSKLTEGGQESMCGWLKDKFGVSWQIVPTILGKLMSDPEKAPRVMQAFLKMKKFDIAALEKSAYG